MPGGHTIATLCLAAVALAGCNDDGRTLAPAPPTTPTAPAAEATTTSVPDDAVPLGLGLTSPDVVDGALLDPRFTCDGLNIAPTLLFRGVPAEAAELAVAVVDLDADGFVHWVVTGLPADTGVLVPGDLPDSAVFARTSTGIAAWDGPCPPAGDEPHRYEFRLYALAEPLGLAPDLDGRDAIELIDAAAVDVARLTARYGAAEAG